MTDPSPQSIEVLPSAFFFAASAGTAPAAQIATVGPAGLPELTVSIDYIDAPPSEWLTAELQSGSTLVLNVVTAGLPGGTYRAAITVETSNPDFLPSQAQVELTISP